MATQRRTIPGRQRLTLRLTRRTVPSVLSIEFVVASERRSRSGRPSLRTVRVSSIPSRRLPAASSCPWPSSQEIRLRSSLRAVSALALL